MSADHAPKRRVICPKCWGDLDVIRDHDRVVGMLCTECGKVYPVKDGPAVRLADP